MTFHRDAVLYASVVSAGQYAKLLLAPSRQADANAMTGEVTSNGQIVAAGASARLTNEEVVHYRGR